MTRYTDTDDPFDYLRKMQQGMRRAFRTMPYMEGELREPLIDLLDQGEYLEVLAEIPGVKKEEIQVNVLPERLSIGAEHKVSRDEAKKEEGFYRKERSYSSFYRSMVLPEEIIPEKTEASYENGILSLKLPKKNPEKSGKKGFHVDIP